MAWFYLCVAGAFEIAWAVGLKYTDGFSRPLPSVGTVLALGASLYFLCIVTQKHSRRRHVCRVGKGSARRERRPWESRCLPSRLRSLGSSPCC